MQDTHPHEHNGSCDKVYVKGQPLDVDSVAQVQQVLLSLTQLDFAEGIDRREAKRFTYKTVAQVELLDAPNADPIPATTQDISVLGMSLTLPHHLPAGKVLTIRFAGPDGQPICLTGRVVWSRNDACGTFSTAVQFIAPPEQG